jgi:uncharacterized protein YqeY
MSPLKMKIREQITTATKLRKDTVKNVLKVVLGEIDTQEVRNKKDLSDEEICKVIKKTLQGIEEMLVYKAGDAGLEEEKVTLTALLPKQLDRVDILFQLASKAEEIKAAKSDGQATGIAMKFFKESKQLVDGTDVTAIVKEIRGG